VEMVRVLVAVAHPGLAAQVSGRGVIMDDWHPRFFLNASFLQNNLLKRLCPHAIIPFLPLEKRILTTIFEVPVDDRTNPQRAIVAGSAS